MRNFKIQPAPGVFGSSPTTVISPFRGPNTTLDQMVKHALGSGGERSILVRQFVEWFTSGIQPKDYLGEILAIRNIFVQRSPFRTDGAPLFRYVNDPRHLELVKSPERLIREIQEHGTCSSDCDEYACAAGTFALVVGREVEFVALGFAPGQLSHVGVRVKEPKSNRWIWLDGVAGPREAEAAGKAKEIAIRSLD